MTPQKAVHNALTGQVEMVDLSSDEIAELEAKQAANILRLETEAVAEQAAAIEATAEQQIIADQPSDEDILNAKDIAGLRTLLLKQNAIITVLVKRQGLES